MSFLKAIRKLKARRRKYKLGGYLEDPIDKEYRMFDAKKFSFKAATSSDIDLRNYSSPRHDQRSTSTCVAQSIVKALEIKRIIKHGISQHKDLSILDVYWGARDLMSPKQTNVDQGTYISLACDVLRRYGVCREMMHQFSEKNLYIPPPVLATREARMNRIKSHFKLYAHGNDLIDEIILNLQSKNPVVFGTQVGDNWMRYPGGNNVIGITEAPEGGHAMVIVGFVEGKFIVENSWGNYWGNDGFAWVAPEVFTHSYTRDLWVIVDGSETWYENDYTH
jgi:C1A family cysteine protease